jgi:hypothetical protein
MSIWLFDPVCEPEVISRAEERKLGGLAGKKVGYIFNQHKSALTFWQTLEQEIEKAYGWSDAHRVYKTNTWASAPKAEIEELVDHSDYALVGVGA